MIGTCLKCGNYDWDKEVTEGRIRCPKCGNEWSFRALPLFILTGCSGIGKTTTGIEIMRRQTDYVVLDADMFYNIMPRETEEDYHAQVEQIESLSRNIAQSGKPVLWTMAGNLDKVNGAYNRRFFSDVYSLALVCEEGELRRRMTEGRAITEEAWINGSVDYNRYFQTHEMLGNMGFETLDLTGLSISEVADSVIAWMRGKENKQ